MKLYFHFIVGSKRCIVFGINLYWPVISSWLRCGENIYSRYAFRVAGCSSYSWEAGGHHLFTGWLQTRDSFFVFTTFTITSFYIPISLHLFIIKNRSISLNKRRSPFEMSNKNFSLYNLPGFFKQIFNIKKIKDWYKLHAFLFCLNKIHWDR